MLLTEARRERLSVRAPKHPRKMTETVMPTTMMPCAISNMEVRDRPLPVKVASSVYFVSDIDPLTIRAMPDT